MSRWFGWFAVVMLAGCDYAYTRRGAPFRLGQLRGQVWAEYNILPKDSDDDLDRYATLILTTEDAPCSVHRNEPFYLHNFLSKGDGLIFSLSNSTYGEAREWTGEWIAGKGYQLSTGTANMEVMLFQDELINYDIAQTCGRSGATWLDIEEADENGISGEFSAGYWHGKFSAENCGAMDTAVP